MRSRSFVLSRPLLHKRALSGAQFIRRSRCSGQHSASCAKLVPGRGRTRLVAQWQPHPGGLPRHDDRSRRGLFRHLSNQIVRPNGQLFVCKRGYNPSRSNNTNLSSFWPKLSNQALCTRFMSSDTRHPLAAVSWQCALLFASSHGPRHASPS